MAVFRFKRAARLPEDVHIDVYIMYMIVPFISVLSGYRRLQGC